MVTRRQMLRMGGSAALGISGAVALAACGETQVVTREVPVDRVVVKEVEVEKIVTQQVEKIVIQEVERIVRQEVPVEKVVEVQKIVEVEKVVEVEKIVTQEVEKVVERVVEVEAMPQKVTAIIRMAHDHSSGPRGAAMGWALDRFAAQFPHIVIKFEPQNHLYMESFGIQIAGGSQAQVALLDGGFVNQWLQPGGFTQINDVLAKHPDWDPSRWYFSPDEYTVNFTDTQPALTRQPIQGPQFGMPYQGGLYGLTMNFSMAEAKGIPMPSPGSWGLETDFIETAKQATDLETGEWGHWMHAHPALMWGAWSFGLSDSGTRMYRNPEGTHFEAFEDGGDRGYRLAIGTIYDHGVAFPPQDSKQFAGEFGNPYSAGNVLYGFHGGGLGGTVTQVGDRFQWGLIPNPEGPRGTIPTWFSNQPHMVSNSAATDGTTEQAVEVVLFMAGTEVQGRIAVDRGNAPVLKETYDSAAFNAGPPDNHAQGLKEAIERDDHRGWQGAHPHWWEWYAWVTAAQLGFIGEETADQSVESVVSASDRILENTKDDYDSYKAWATSLTS